MSERQDTSRKNTPTPDRLRYFLAANVAWQMAWQGDELFYISPTCEKITGHAWQDFMSDPDLLETLIYPADHASWRAQIQQCRENLTDVHFQVRVLGPDHKPCWVEWDEVVVRDEKQHFFGFLSTIRDINESKLNEERIIVEREFSDAVLDAAKAVILVLDTEGRIVRYNRFLEQLTGRTETDHVGKDWFTNFLPEMDYDRVRQRFKESIFEDERTEGYINPITTTDGRLVDLAWYDQLLLDANGNKIGLVAVGHDLTEVEAARQSAENAEQRARGYFKLGHVGMAITSLEKGWLEFNDRLCEILGYDREQLRNVTWPEITHPDDLDADVDNFNKILSGQSEGYDMEKRFIHGTGRHVVYARISVRAVRDLYGEISYFVALVEDITELKMAQFQLEALNENLEETVQRRTRALTSAYEELREAHDELRDTQNALIQSEKMSSIGMMAAGVAHELNNPLMGIVNYVEFAQSIVEEGSETAEILSKAQRQLARMTDLIRNFLTLSRPQTSVKSRMIDLEQPLREAVDLMAAVYRASDIEMTCDVVKGQFKVWGDDAAIQQIIVNLLMNARDAMASSAVKQLTITTEQSANTISVLVADSGRGVRESAIHRIFDPFFTTKAVGAGTGLGLPLATTLATAMDGTLHWLQTIDFRPVPVSGLN